MSGTKVGTAEEIIVALRDMESGSQYLINGVYKSPWDGIFDTDKIRLLEDAASWRLLSELSDRVEITTRRLLARHRG